MVLRAHHSPPSGSRSPISSKHSPASRTTSLTPPMPADDNELSSRSARSTPNRQPIELPRTQLASKGGCWTCRLRRKKCDEQREGDSCKTCIRLTIECLGWGHRRPDWMRDKQAVEAYKANIKAQLTRAGLIRGQPRSILPSTHNTASALSQSRSQPHQSVAAPEMAHQSPQPSLEPEFSFSFLDPPQRPQRHGMLPAMPGASNSSFHQLPAASYSDPAVNTLGIQSQFYSYSPSSLTDPYSFDLTQITGPIDPSVNFGIDVRPPSPQQSGFDHVVYYFEHVRKIQYIFAGNTFTNITYSLILQDLRGAVSNAVCALACLHYMRVRIAQGLELPGLESERSQAAYFHDEAVFQLTTAKQHHGSYTESDAIAALHLVSYSQMSGCKDDWQRNYAVACEWVTQTGLFLEDSNPRRIFDGMSSTGQLIVKITLWIDVFSSLTLIRPPRYLRVCRQLLGGDHQNDFWTPTGGLRMDKVSGCPDEALLCIAETSALAHWKSAEKRNNTLSYRELIRRGDAIEQHLQQHETDLSDNRETPASPLNPALASTMTSETDLSSTLAEGTRRIVADLFREAALLYLNTVLSECNPGVSEIHASVDKIVSYLNQIPPSEADRGLMFPICLAGAMTDDSRLRAFFKRRLAHRDEGLGNIPHCRVLMEGVWQKRDCDRISVDLRETAQACNLNLLLV